MERTSEAQVIYTARPSIAPATEAEVLANVYRYLIFKCRVEKEAAHPAAPNEAKGLKDARPAKRSLSR
jgi:hypothetical protein